MSRIQPVFLSKHLSFLLRSENQWKGKQSESANGQMKYGTKANLECGWSSFSSWCVCQRKVVLSVEAWTAWLTLTEASLSLSARERLSLDTRTPLSSWGNIWLLSGLSDGDEVFFFCVIWPFDPPRPSIQFLRYLCLCADRQAEEWNIHTLMYVHMSRLYKPSVCAVLWDFRSNDVAHYVCVCVCVQARKDALYKCSMLKSHKFTWMCMCIDACWCHSGNGNKRCPCWRRFQSGNWSDNLSVFEYFEKCYIPLIKCIIIT